MIDSYSSVSESLRGNREARLDQFVGQELFADASFGKWILDECGRNVPSAEPVDVRLNTTVDDQHVPVDSTGETDVRAVLRLDNGQTITLLIEDKIYAPFQTRQAERYRGRADHLEGLAVLIAPKSYSSRPQVEFFDAVIAIEDLVIWFKDRGDRRGEWIAEQLRSLIEVKGQPDAHPGVVEFAEFCVGWLAEHAPAVEPYVNSMRTLNTSWLEFRTPVGLQFKAGGWAAKDHGAVDFKIPGMGEEELQVALATRPLTGFVIDHDTTAAALLRFPTAKFRFFEGVPDSAEQLQQLIAALDACRRAAEWLLDIQADERSS